MPTVSLATLRTRVRDEGDYQLYDGTGFITDTELRTWINQAWYELYDLMVAHNQSRFYSTQSISVVAGTDSYNLASDFLNLVGVDIVDGNDSYPMERYNFNERNDFQNNDSNKFLARYHIRDAYTLRIAPSPQWSGTITVHYIPTPKTLIDLGGGDPTPTQTYSISTVNGWEDYIVYRTLTRCALKDGDEQAGAMWNQLRLEVAERVKRNITADLNQVPRVADRTRRSRWPWNRRLSHR